VGTTDGREIDRALAQRDLGLGERPGQAAELILSVLQPVAVCVVIALLLHTRRRGRLQDGIRATLIVASAALGARALKAGLEAVDPARAEAARWLGGGFYPSGHAAVAMALALATILAARDHRRAFVLGGVAWCSVHGFVIVATRSHHVSDVLGGYLLAIALALLIGLRSSAHAQATPCIDWTGLLTIVTAPIAAALVMEVARRTAVPPTQPRATQAVIAVGLTAAASLLVIGFVRLVNGAVRR